MAIRYLIATDEQGTAVRGEASSYELPILLRFDGRGGLLPGRGEAGWTVYTFDSAAERASYMAAHRESRMPCWARIERGEAR